MELMQANRSFIDEAHWEKELKWAEADEATARKYFKRAKSMYGKMTKMLPEYTAKYKAAHKQWQYEKHRDPKLLTVKEKSKDKLYRTKTHYERPGPRNYLYKVVTEKHEINAQNSVPMNEPASVMNAAKELTRRAEVDTKLNSAGVKTEIEEFKQYPYKASPYQPGHDVTTDELVESFFTEA